LTPRSKETAVNSNVNINKLSEVSGIFNYPPPSPSLSALLSSHTRRPPAMNFTFRTATYFGWKPRAETNMVRACVVSMKLKWLTRSIILHLISGVPPTTWFFQSSNNEYNYWLARTSILCLFPVLSRTNCTFTNLSFLSLTSVIPPSIQNNYHFNIIIILCLVPILASI
jgi:hypothetical protein